MSDEPRGAPAQPPAKASRRPFFLVLGLFFAPLAAAFWAYYGIGWRPVGNTSSGELVVPARPLPSVSLPTPEGRSTPAEFLREKWSLVYVDDGACDESCRHALTDMRQVRLALNNEMTRVQRVFLYNGSCCDQDYFSKEQTGLIVAKVDVEQGAPLAAAFPKYGGAPLAAAKRIYIVDPLGNLMMSYAPGAPAKGMLKDLKKLLSLSHIG